jgi:hypothetical protein
MVEGIFVSSDKLTETKAPGNPWPPPRPPLCEQLQKVQSKRSGIGLARRCTPIRDDWKHAMKAQLFKTNP